MSQTPPQSTRTGPMRSSPPPLRRVTSSEAASRSFPSRLRSNNNSQGATPNYHHRIWELSEQLPPYSEAPNNAQSQGFSPLNSPVERQNWLNSPVPENARVASVPSTQEPGAPNVYSQATDASNPPSQAEVFIPPTAPPTPYSNNNKNNTNSQSTQPVSFPNNGNPTSGGRKKIRVKRKVPKTRKSKKSQTKKRAKKGTRRH